MTEPLVTIDDASDRSRASDGVSRYGAYLRKSAEEFRDTWDDTVAPPVEYAAAAWRNATGPIMVPGYAEIRNDINGIRITADESGDGNYAIEVTIPLNHRALKPLFPSYLGLHDFGDWYTETSPFSEHGSFWDPKYTRALLLTTTRLLIPLAESMLPTPNPDTPASTVSLADAKASVRAVADIVNRQAGPVVESLRSAR
ncbi:hypothetical protein [Catenulispora rubra]|uniref:hypothetical protein n=1 Tax=Catenulispora rubra TaxID=280293 RepID=UPI001892551D|nr:hypothetical protein [Catenulispora rubra]